MNYDAVEDPGILDRLSLAEARRCCAGGRAQVRVLASSQWHPLVQEMKACGAEVRVEKVPVPAMYPAEGEDRATWVVTRSGYARSDRERLIQAGQQCLGQVGTKTWIPHSDAVLTGGQDSTLYRVLAPGRVIVREEIVSSRMHRVTGPMWGSSQALRRMAFDWREPVGPLTVYLCYEIVEGQPLRRVRRAVEKLPVQAHGAFWAYQCSIKGIWTGSVVARVKEVVSGRMLGALEQMGGRPRLRPWAFRLACWWMIRQWRCTHAIVSVGRAWDSLSDDEQDALAGVMLSWYPDTIIMLASSEPGSQENTRSA